MALLRFPSTFSHQNFIFSEFWCTIAIMQEKQQNVLFEIECLGALGQGKEKEKMRSSVEANDNTPDPEAKEDKVLKISLNVLLVLGGKAVTAVRSSGSQSSMSVLISSEYFTISLGGEEEEDIEKDGKEVGKEKDVKEGKENKEKKEKKEKKKEKEKKENEKKKKEKKKKNEKREKNMKKEKKKKNEMKEKKEKKMKKKKNIKNKKNRNNEKKELTRRRRRKRRKGRRRRRRLRRKMRRLERKRNNTCMKKVQEQFF